MFKIIRKIITLTLLLISYVWIKKESFTEQWLSKQFQTTTTVGRISISPTKIILHHVVLHNPITHYEQPYAAQIERIHLNFSLVSSLFSKKLEITEALVCGTTLFHFQKRLQHASSIASNWDQILHNIHSFSIDHRINPTETFPQRYLPHVNIQQCQFINTSIFKHDDSLKQLPPLYLPHMAFYPKENPCATIPPSPQQTLLAISHLFLQETFFYARLPIHIHPTMLAAANTYYQTASSLNLSSSQRPNRSIAKKHTSQFLQGILNY